MRKILKFNKLNNISAGSCFSECMMGQGITAAIGYYGFGNDIFISDDYQKFSMHHCGMQCDK